MGLTPKQQNEILTFAISFCFRRFGVHRASSKISCTVSRESFQVITRFTYIVELYMEVGAK